MDPNTFTGFEEFISSMGTWFEERTSSMELECLKIVGFQRHWKGGRSESGGRWKGWWRWEVIATNEEEVRDEASVNKSPTKFSSPFPCSFSFFLLYFFKEISRENITIFFLIFSFIFFIHHIFHVIQTKENHFPLHFFSFP